jgi:hypothetical protein
VTGGSALTVPWGSPTLDVQEVGTVTFSFTDKDNGSMAVVIDGVSAKKTIQRQVFSTLTPGAAMTALWYNISESGWGTTLVFFNDTATTEIYTYDANGNPIWYVASNCAITGTSCTGDLYEVTGGQAITDPWQGINPAVNVGTVTVTFSDDDNGTMTFTINGVSGSKSITRQVFN